MARHSLRAPTATRIVLSHVQEREMSLEPTVGRDSIELLRKPLLRCEWAERTPCQCRRGLAGGWKYSQALMFRAFATGRNGWLGGRDSNPDTVVQSHVSYRWTTSQYLSGWPVRTETLIIDVPVSHRQPHARQRTGMLVQ